MTLADLGLEEVAIRVMEKFDLDIFVCMKGKTLDDFRSNLRQLDSDGARIPFLAPQDLIFLKEGSWREKD